MLNLVIERNMVRHLSAERRSFDYLDRFAND